MKYKLLANLLLMLIIFLPVKARATLYMIWVVDQNITQVVCFEGMIEVANQFDPSQYINLTNLSTDVK